MSHRLTDIVRFRGDRLFNGAVSINWFSADKLKSVAASEAFVFHGPTYHGVQQQDVGTSHGHHLMDTASFARAIVRRCYGLEDQPFTLAIAGYGTGKSHLGLTLASLVSAPDGDVAQHILSAIESADTNIGSDIRILLQETRQPCLALALNGMQSFDLTAEITKQIVQILKIDGHDSKPLDDLRPRFRQAASLIRMSNQDVVKELLVACEVADIGDLFNSLERQDERTYIQVHDFFAARGMPIRVLAGESVRDVIDVTVREYCGHGKPYRSLLVLFDEFGKYTEFATVRSQISGSGVLQDLFEAIQANSGSACFVGFIQFELNAYIQRVAPEYKNEILRYVTRYQSADRAYLSINLETLIASLIEKRQNTLLEGWFDREESRDDSEASMLNLCRWFPQAKNHRLWCDSNQFHTVIRQGCWPLSPYTTWLLFYLTATGKHLQERSALTLLGDMFLRYEHVDVPDTGDWSLSPVDLWSDTLQQELISSEESGQQGSSTHAYASVMAKHGPQLSPDLQRLLCATVLASKLNLQATDKDDAIEALAKLSGIPPNNADSGIRLLQEEYNVLEWDDAFKAFEILGEAVPRTQFVSFVRHRVASSYDESGKAKLFASKAAAWCKLLHDFDSEFAEENSIMTREWCYQAVTSTLEYLPQQIKIACDRWENAVAVDEPRGTVIYAYVEPSRSIDAVVPDARKLLKKAADRDTGATTLPILVVLLHDVEGILGQALAEYNVLEEAISNEDRVRFGRLIDAHKEKMDRVIHEQVESMLKQRYYVTGLKEELEANRLARAGTELFARIYKTPIPFPFDGFNTAKGNAAETCQILTQELFCGKLDYDAVMNKPVKVKNRAVKVLKETWGIFTMKGDVSRRPTYSTLRSITEKWDNALLTEQRRLPVEDAMRQMCRPPYGANIASAGLFMGVFIAPRSDKIVAVHDGKQLAISQWVQDGVFGGKYIDLSSLRGIDLVLLGEESSEWETLLDEWEQCDNHLARKSCFERAMELKRRVPVPPLSIHREAHLAEQAHTSIEALSRMDKEQNDAILRITQGEERPDANLLVWGATSLKNICDKMNDEKPLWTDSQIAEIRPHYERARQASILFFPDWLTRQAPLNDAPDTVGQFKHRMNRLGHNLAQIGLEDQSQQLEAHTLKVIRNAETIAEANQLLRDVRSWLTSCGDPVRMVRIAEIRSFREKGTDYSRKLQGMAERAKTTEITEARSRLSEFLIKLKDVEAQTVRRAEGLWHSKIRTQEDVEHILDEIESLLPAFESLSTDMQDLHLMQRALRLYQKDYQSLLNDNMSWNEFEMLATTMKNEGLSTFKDGELPWSPNDVLDGFVQNISKRRKEASLAWVESVESEVAGIASMPVTDANRFHTRVNNPPPVVTEPHLKRTAVVAKKVEARLIALNVEWLVEKFKELPSKAKKDFLHRVQKLSDEQ